MHKDSTRKIAAELVPEPTKHKKSKLKLEQEFMNKVIADEKDIDDKIHWNYFKYQNPLFLAKDLKENA